MKIATEAQMSQAMCGLPVLKAGKLYVITGPDIIERTIYTVALLWLFAIRHGKSVFYVSRNKRAVIFKRVMRAMVGPKSENSKEKKRAARVLGKIKKAGLFPITPEFKNLALIRRKPQLVVLDVGDLIKIFPLREEAIYSLLKIIAAELGIPLLIVVPKFMLKRSSAVDILARVKRV